MKIVFVHRRGPGQFRHLAAFLAYEGWEVTVVCETVEEPIEGVRFVTHRPPAPALGGAPHLVAAEQHVRRGHAVAEALDAMARREGKPDLIAGHIGWGSLLFAKDVLPHTPVLGYCEYFYRPEGSDLGFDPAETVTRTDRERLRGLNMAQLATLDAIEAGFSPTRWQRSLYPAHVRPRIAICHEGIDTTRCRPDPSARFDLPDGRTVAAGDPVVTYAARSLEPYRGFPQFMRAAAKIAERRPDILFLVAGGEGVTYGRPPADGRSWRAVMMEETGLDPDCIVFLGTLPHERLIRLFQVSAAHVYLTVPFVLSWSMLEAMAAGALIVGSATPPVEEVVADGKNGLIADFWDTDALAERVIEAAARPAAYEAIRRRARETIERRFALQPCLDRQLSILDVVRRRQAPLPAARTVVRGAA